jgi:uncharacterized repeat protein (TIGR03803 family)
MGKLELLRMICVVLIFCIAGAIASPAQIFSILGNFDFPNGSGPNVELIQGTDGNFYGTTGQGGTNNNCTDGCGTVFKITAKGALTSLHSFNGTDGSFATGLVQGTNGNFYGTTANGGNNNCTDGCGTVFKITAKGVLTSLHSFNGTDGSGPYSGLIRGVNGSFYGTTDYGGSNTNCAGGCGTVFKITAKGVLTSLHSFDGTDGSTPNAGLVQGIDGDFYGTTYSGGANGCGTVFKLNSKNTLTSLHSFNGTDGCGVYSGLIQGTDGNFYGTTEVGGLYTDGTVFQMTTEGAVTTLHSFSNTDGSYPAGLVQGTDGNLYGATQGGGNFTYGTVFQITAAGALTTLHSFDYSDGEDPQSAPVQATSGIFYGTTYFGGADGYGTVFSLSIGLGPFVETQTSSGKVGADVNILGTDLTDATGVTFNGTAAVFKVVSSSEIKAEVPAGATSGAVRVTTPSGTLTSNVNFQVRP